MSKALSDEAFDALKKTVFEIDFRSKRLMEWRELGMRLQNSESRFDVFRAMWPGNNLPEPAALLGLGAAWSDCEQQMLEVSLLPEAFQCITLALGDRKPDPMVKSWIEELTSAGRKVGEDLSQKRFGDLPGHVAEYKGLYTKITILRNARINTEVNGLASLTNELRLKFE